MANTIPCRDWLRFSRGWKRGIGGVNLAGLILQKDVFSIIVISITSGYYGSWQLSGQHSSRLRARRLAAIQLTPTISPCSYDSNLNVSRDDKKNKFASTMEFVEDYLNNVVSEAVPFANEEKNKLTFEVRVLLVSLARCRMQHSLSATASATRVAVLASLFPMSVYSAQPIAR